MQQVKGAEPGKCWRPGVGNCYHRIFKNIFVKYFTESILYCAKYGNMGVKLVYSYTN